MFKYLALDWGEKYCGLAVGDKDSGLILPFTKPCTNNEIIQTLRTEIENRSIEFIILGIPANFHGKPTKTSHKIWEFLKSLEIEFGLSISGSENLNSNNLQSDLVIQPENLLKSKNIQTSLDKSNSLESNLKTTNKFAKLKIILFDERNTTKQALSLAKTKNQTLHLNQASLNHLAAQKLLENYFGG